MVDRAVWEKVAKGRELEQGTVGHTLVRGKAKKRHCPKRSLGVQDRIKRIEKREKLALRNKAKEERNT